MGDVISQELKRACEVQEQGRLQEAADLLEKLLSRMSSGDRGHKLEAFENLESIYESLADQEDVLQNKTPYFQKRIEYGDKYIQLADPEDEKRDQLIEAGTDVCLQLFLSLQY